MSSALRTGQSSADLAGRSIWVVLDIAFSAFMDLDWFHATFFRWIFDPNAEDRLLANPRAGLEGRYYVLL